MPSATKVQTGYLEAVNPFSLASGTASAPTLTFTNSTATGMFSPSAGVLAFSTGSTQNALTILTDGKVGIGTTNPSSKLHVIGDIYTSTQANINGLYLTEFSQWLPNADLVAGKKVLVTLPNNENYSGTIKISTPRPANDNSSVAASLLTFRFIRTGGSTGTWAKFYVYAIDNYNNNVNYQWYFDSSTGTPYLRFSQAVNSYTHTIFLESTNSTSGYSVVVDNGSAPSGTAISPLTEILNTFGADWSIKNNGNSSLFIQGSTGNVGISDTNPNTKLTVQGTGQFVATSSNSATVDASIYANTPLQTVSAFFGQLASTTSLTGDQYSTAIRFNGNDVAWGDISYYPNQGGKGHFRFSLTPNTVDTTPDAKLGVGDLYSAGNVGIGTTNPSQKLHVYDTVNNPIIRVESKNVSGQGNPQLILARGAEDTLRLEGVANVEGRISTNVANVGFLTFYTGTAENERLRIDAAGNIGIGTNVAYAKLHIIGNQYIENGNYFTANTSGYFFAGNNSYAGGIFAGSSGNLVTIRSPQTTVFENNSTQTLSIDSTGYIVAGKRDRTVNNFQILEIAGRFTGSNGNYSGLYFRNSQDAGGSSSSIRAGRFGDNYGSDISFWTQIYGQGAGGDGAERVRITSTGNVGIGTTNPNTKLQIWNSSTQLMQYDGSGNLECHGPEVGNNGTYVRLGAAYNQLGLFTSNTMYLNAVNGIVLGDQGNGRIWMTASGSLGIGTNAPQAPFGGRALQLGNVSDGRTVLTLASADRGSIYFADGTSGGSTFTGFLDYVHADDAMYIGTGSTPRFEVNNTRSYAQGGVAGNTTYGANSYGVATSGRWNQFFEADGVQVIRGYVSGGDNYPNCGSAPTKYPIMGVITGGGGYDSFIHITVVGSHRGIGDSSYNEYSEWLVMHGDIISFQKLNTVATTWSGNRWNPWRDNTSTAGVYSTTATYPWNVRFSVAPNCGAGLGYTYIVRWYHGNFVPHSTRSW